MKTVDDVNSRELVNLILKDREKLTVIKSQIQKIDFIATMDEDKSKKYGIVVKYRNIPETETRSQVFEDLDEIEKICENNDLIPTIAFVVYDKESHTVRTYIFTVEHIRKLAGDDILKDEVREVEKGVQIKFGINKRTITEKIVALGNHLDCSELTTNEKNFFV